MKNVELKAKKGLLVNKSFVGLLIALVAVSAVAYGVLRDQFSSDKDAPPSLSLDTELMQGLIKTGIYLRFDDSDFERTINLPTPTMRNRGLGYFYAERDMTMLEIANSIAPDEDLKVIIAHFGENLDPLEDEEDRIFYTFPYGRYSNTKEISEDNESDYIVKAYEGIIIAGSKNFGTWNLKQASQMPLRTFSRMNNLEKGWNLIASDDLENTFKSCQNRVASVWEFKNKRVLRESEFKQIDIYEPEFSEDKYLAWFYISGDKNSCVDSRVASGSRCVDKELKESNSLICVNNNFVPCDSSTIGSSVFSSEFICNGSAWVRSSSTSISVNSVIPSINVPYEAQNSVTVFFNEENVIPSDDLSGVTLKKSGDSGATDKALEVTFDENAGFVNVKYSLLEPLTRYEIAFPAGELKRNNVESEDDLFASFVTSSRATPPYIGKTSCTDPNGGIDILNGNTVQKECATCVCRFGTLACPRIMCPEENPNSCSVNGEKNKDGALCVNGRYLECIRDIVTLNESLSDWTLSGGVYSNITGARYVCENDTWVFRTRLGTLNNRFSEGSEEESEGSGEAGVETPKEQLFVDIAYHDDSNFQEITVTPMNLFSGERFEVDQDKFSLIRFGHLDSNGDFISDLANTDCAGSPITSQIIFNNVSTLDDFARLKIFANTKQGIEYELYLPEGLFYSLGEERILSMETRSDFQADYLRFLNDDSCFVDEEGREVRLLDLACSIRSERYADLSELQKKYIEVLFEELKDSSENAYFPGNFVCDETNTSLVCDVCGIGVN